MTTVHEISYSYAVLEGTSYEIGKAQGEQFLANAPDYVDFMTSKGPLKTNLTQVKRAIAFFERYTPGVNEEIHGFADAVGVHPERIVYYAVSHSERGHCSHFAALPALTADRHLYVGRSYEWGLKDDFRLCTTRVSGKAAHSGFSVYLFGRLDGLNEYGLTVTMSAAIPKSKPQEDGCLFWAVIRTVLERCQTVPEAIDLIQAIPIAFNFNLIVADRSGAAALMEIVCAQRSVKQIGPQTPEQLLCSTNHLTLPGTAELTSDRHWHSLVRHQTLESRLRAAAPHIDPAAIRAILSDHLPDGVCCHYYSEGLGTLWSILYDLTAGTMEVCFGSPQLNPWQTIRLTDPVGVHPVTAKLPDESSHGDIWRKITALGRKS